MDRQEDLKGQTKPEITDLRTEKDDFGFGIWEFLLCSTGEETFWQWQ